MEHANTARQIRAEARRRGGAEDSPLRLRVSALLCAIALIAGAGARTAAQSAPETAEQHNTAGWKAADQKDFKRAKKEFERAAKLKQDYPEAYLGLALVAWAQNKPLEVIKHVDQALALRPDYAEARFVRARYFYVRDDLQAARAEIELALKYNSKLYAAHALVADLEIAAERLEPALASFETSRRLAPKEFDANPRTRERYETLKIHFEDRAFVKTLSGERTKPRILNRPVPQYTDAARENKVAGTVRVFIRINEKGSVDRTLVLTGLPDGLDDSAVRAVSQLRADPATMGGRPIPAWSTVTVHFTIR